MKKYPIVTITESAYNTIKTTMQADTCRAKTIEIVCNEIYHCSVRELACGYWSDEYKAIRYVVDAVYENRNNRLHIVKGE